MTGQRKRCLSRLPIRVICFCVNGTQDRKEIMKEYREDDVLDEMLDDSQWAEKINCPDCGYVPAHATVCDRA